MLDPALTRPGRLSRRVTVPLPDERGRAEILGVHMRGIPLALGVDKAAACASLAKITAGFSGAELANVVNEAALLAGRKEAEVRDGVCSGVSQLHRLHFTATVGDTVYYVSLECNIFPPVRRLFPRGNWSCWGQGDSR